MRRTVLEALVLAGVLMALLACPGGTKAPPEGVPDALPGMTYNVGAALSAALGCPQADITWAVVEPDGGTVVDGTYKAPACGAANLPGTFHVTGTGCGKTAAVAITVKERVLSVAVCGVAPGGTCCAPAIEMGPGETAQWYATVTYSCPGHVEFSPAPPPAACP